MKYIGVTGHRGSGKTSIAYLLGNLLENLRWNLTKEQCQTQYNRCCKLIQENNNAIYDCGLDYVYFDEFGETPKYMVATLLGIDMSVLDNDTLKDTMYVNLKDFKLYSYEDNFKIITVKDILDNTSKKWKDAYMSLGEFARCFSVDIMQKMFGTDVWLKTRIVNDTTWPDTTQGWKIFSDVKTKDEIKYIKDNEGILIETVRLTKKKKNNGISNIDETCTVDYIIITEGDLGNLFDKMYNIATDIYEKSTNNSI